MRLSRSARTRAFGVADVLVEERLPDKHTRVDRRVVIEDDLGSAGPNHAFCDRSAECAAAPDRDAFADEAVQRALAVATFDDFGAVFAD